MPPAGRRVRSLPGLGLGSVAGYWGRIPETLVMRGMDVVFGLPPILLANSVAATLGPGLVNLIISPTIVLIPPMTRVTYHVVVILKEQSFVEAARATGARPHQAVFDQILPNGVVPVIAFATSLAGASVVFGAGISLIGLGIQPPDPITEATLDPGRSYGALNPEWL